MTASPILDGFDFTRLLTRCLRVLINWLKSSNYHDFHRHRLRSFSEYIFPRWSYFSSDYLVSFLLILRINHSSYHKVEYAGKAVENSGQVMCTKQPSVSDTRHCYQNGYWIKSERWNCLGGGESRSLETPCPRSESEDSNDRSTHWAGK